MNKLKKITLIVVIFLVFLAGLVMKAPAWLVGSLASKYSQNRLVTRNETGTFWKGSALLVASDGNNKKYVPLLRVNWTIKLGLTKFINIDLTSAGQTVANVNLVKTGLDINNVNLSFAMDQLTAFAGNLGSLNLSGNVHVTSSNLHLGKTNSGSIDVSLSGIGSGMSPLNPIGNYNVKFDLSNMGINVDTDGDSIIKVSGSGNVSGLSLNARVDDEKKEQMLQFMTMMGLPQADGSYLLKVF